MKKLWLSLIFVISIFMILSPQASALVQYGGEIEAMMSPGETLVLEWELKASEGDGAIDLQLGSRGWGSQFVSYAEDTLHIPEGEKGTVEIIVTIPPDHPGGVILGEDSSLRASATQLSAQAGATIVNVQASKILIITILQNVDEQYWSNTAYDEPEPEVVEEVMAEETMEEEKPMEREAPSGPLSIGSSQSESEEETSMEEEGGGCLISTATFGSELAPQVQMLREIRDNGLLTTQSGSSFMTGFNTLYYSFSPAIADLERQSPIFKEVVKVTITPLLASLSLLNYVDMDSEAEVLGYGISLILLNAGMYFVAPAIIISKLRKRF